MILLNPLFVLVGILTYPSESAIDLEDNTFQFPFMVQLFQTNRM